jgi:hypothetical protein
VLKGRQKLVLGLGGGEVDQPGDRRWADWTGDPEAARAKRQRLGPKEGANLAKGKILLVREVAVIMPV